MTKVLLLLWHPHNAVAGGFVRVQEFLPHLGDVDITIIDNTNSIAKGKIINGKIIEYHIPHWIKKIYDINFILGRLFEWIFALKSLITIGAKELRGGKYHLIYGPTGDNLHIFLAGVVLKRKFPNAKLLLDVLNLEMPEGSFKNNFLSAYKNGVGFLRSAVSSIGMVLLLTIERSLIKNCDFVVTVSPYMKKIIGKYFPSSKIDFTPSGVSLPKIINRTFSNKTINGIYVGRHTPEKGIFDLIKVWSSLCKYDNKAQLKLMGFCDPVVKIKLEEEIKKYKLDKNIEILGVVSSVEKANQLKKADIFFHLAYFEPLVPVITILEAFAYGLPVITYTVPAFDDYPYLKKEKAFYIVKNKDIDKVVDTVTEYANKNKSEKSIIAVDAMRLARMFSWKEITQKELAIIKSLTK